MVRADLASTGRQLHFNAFLMSCGHHEAAWRLPGSDPFASLDLGHWRNLARIAEQGTFDSIFLADGPEQVIPLLRKRGAFRTEYTGRTLREHYGIPRPDSQFTATGERVVVA
jgi:hypothetical protein